MYKQAEYDGKLPKFCADCGLKLNGDDENYLSIGHSEDYHANRKFIFVTGRVKGKKADFRFDTETLDVYMFPEHEADLTELLFLKTFLNHYAEGRIKIFGEYMR